MVLMLVPFTVMAASEYPYKNSANVDMSEYLDKRVPTSTTFTVEYTQSTPDGGKLLFSTKPVSTGSVPTFQLDTKVACQNKDGDFIQIGVSQYAAGPSNAFLIDQTFETPSRGLGAVVYNIPYELEITERMCTVKELSIACYVEAPGGKYNSDGTPYTGYKSVELGKFQIQDWQSHTPETRFFNGMKGSGTESDPWIITTAAQLEALSTLTWRDSDNPNITNEYSTGHYKLGNDIDISEYGLNYYYGSGWVHFLITKNGVFDGDGHVISGLTTRKFLTYGGGLCVINGTVKNLGIVDVNITGIYSANIGPISYMGGGSLINCYATGKVTIPDSLDKNFGALVGFEYKPTIVDCSSEVEIIKLPERELLGLDAPNVSTADVWAQENINSAVAKGFVPSDTQNSYTNVITRQEFCRMAVKFVEYQTGKTIDAILKEKSLTVNEKWFSDTTDPAILAAYALGITSGTLAPTDTTPGTFTPNGEFTREQAARMLMNLYAVTGTIVPVSDQGYTDIGEASAWAVDAINWANANGVMNGTGNNKFTPKTAFTRQESIVTFDRIG
jgi:hypothetical protein